MLSRSNKVQAGITFQYLLDAPSGCAGVGQWSVIQAVAPLLGLEPSPITVRAGTE